MVRLECLKVKAKTNEGTYLRVHVTTFSTNASCSIFLPLHSFWCNGKENLSAKVGVVQQHRPNRL